MWRIRMLHLLWLIPIAWIDALRIRKQSFPYKFYKMQKWTQLFFKCVHIQTDVQLEQELPSDHAVLFVSNHQSAFDIPLLLATLPKSFTFVSKKENASIPFVASCSKTLELIFFDRKDQKSAVQMLRESARWLKEDKSLLIFPEGTRSKQKSLLEMHAGSIQPAMMTKTLIVPVIMYNSYNYKEILKGKEVAKVKILAPISYEEYKKDKAEGFMKILQEKMQAELINE